LRKWGIIYKGCGCHKSGILKETCWSGDPCEKELGGLRIESSSCAITQHPLPPAHIPRSPLPFFFFPFLHRLVQIQHLATEEAAFQRKQSFKGSTPSKGLYKELPKELHESDTLDEVPQAKTKQTVQWETATAVHEKGARPCGRNMRPGNQCSPPLAASAASASLCLPETPSSSATHPPALLHQSIMSRNRAACRHMNSPV
jgi:hypothetical protein